MLSRYTCVYILEGCNLCESSGRTWLSVYTRQPPVYILIYHVDWCVGHTDSHARPELVSRRERLKRAILSYITRQNQSRRITEAAFQTTTRLASSLSGFWAPAGSRAIAALPFCRDSAVHAFSFNKLQLFLAFYWP